MTQRWTIDPAHSQIGFHVRHLMISNVHGRFATWDGSIDFDPDIPTRSRVRITIDAASVDTHEPQRDAHLRSAEFFDVATHAAITFEATEIERLTLDDYEVAGNLAIRGLTQRVIFDMSRSRVIVDPHGQRRVGFTVAGTISRKAFGLTWAVLLDAGAVMIGDVVTISAELEAIYLPDGRQVSDLVGRK